MRPSKLGFSSALKLLLVGLTVQFALCDDSFTLKISDCAPEEEALVSKAVDSMKLAASVAEDRTGKLLDVLKRNLGPNDIVKGSDLSTLMFFETVFGECAGRERVEDIHKRIETFRNFLNNPKYKVNIVCREGFLKQEEGLDLDTEVMDMRPAEWGGRTLNFVEDKSELFPCKNPEAQAWSSTKYDMLPELVDLTVLCDQTLKSSNWNEHNSAPYATLREKTFDADSIKIDNIDDNNLATVLTHEFSHSGSIFDCDGGTYDYDVNGETCYGWKLITELAKQNPGAASRNAGKLYRLVLMNYNTSAEPCVDNPQIDTFAMFLLGLTLDKNDWSTGNSKPVPPDFPGPISRPVWREGRWQV
ncbi:hypothetical protein LOZ58_002768 [Ophidiomyces ophidiicola]|nr:hypothetical protein LOZ58_002768 [Ophidiomyces ophidiicola]